MDDIFVYTIKLPAGIHEIVMPCVDGYTIYIDERLDQQNRMEAYKHALEHIRNHDFEKEDVQEIEFTAHKR